MKRLVGRLQVTECPIRSWQGFQMGSPSSRIKMPPAFETGEAHTGRRVLDSWGSPAIRYLFLYVHTLCRASVLAGPCALPEVDVCKPLLSVTGDIAGCTCRKCEVAITTAGRRRQKPNVVSRIVSYTLCFLCLQPCRSRHKSLDRRSAEAALVNCLQVSSDVGAIAFHFSKMGNLLPTGKQTTLMLP